MLTGSGALCQEASAAAPSSTTASAGPQGSADLQSQPGQRLGSRRPKEAQLGSASAFAAPAVQREVDGELERARERAEEAEGQLAAARQRLESAVQVAWSQCSASSCTHWAISVGECLVVGQALLALQFLALFLQHVLQHHGGTVAEPQIQRWNVPACKCCCSW